MKFNYVMSALGMCGFNEHNDLSKEVINKYMSNLDFDFSMLFNAFTEANEGPKYYNNYPYKELLSDSGGLQITTLGLDPKEVKKKHKDIYEVQAKYSTHAMVFDEMPIKLSHIIGGGQSRLDTSNRYFIRELVKEKAILTSENIKEQIEVFDRLNSNTKIMIIAQGNNIETYKEYIETIVNNLSDDELKFIGGIAPSGACNGNGTLDRFDIVYGIKEYDIPDHIKKKVHLLGVGTADALIPFVGSPDYFNFIDEISFDSSSAPRKYRIDGDGLNKQKFGKSDSKEEYERKYKEILIKHKPEFVHLMKLANQKFDLDFFIENATYYSSKNDKKIWMWRNRECKLSEALSHLLWFFIPMENVENVMNKINHYKNNNLPILKDISTYEEYMKLRGLIKQYYRLNSKKISYMETLNDFEKKECYNEMIDDLF